jgi:hypothetical protein
MTQKLDLSKKSGEEILQTIEPKRIIGWVGAVNYTTNVERNRGRKLRDVHISFRIAISVHNIFCNYQDLRKIPRK